MKGRNREFWTKERVIAGLQRFQKDFNETPLSSEAYAKKQQFTGEITDGKHSTQGYRQKYPSFASVLKHFSTFREAWRECGFKVDRGFEEWTRTEDWFVVESCGILSRQEVAEYIGRSYGAVKRRLYDLGGITANSRWGMSVSKASKLMNIQDFKLYNYVEHGDMPIFRGYKVNYLNPADLLMVREYDWSNPNPELEKEVRKALVHRACKIITYGSHWRNYEIYKTEDAIVKPRKRLNQQPQIISVLPPNFPVAVGDWVTTIESVNGCHPGRRGVVRQLSFVNGGQTRLDGTNRDCWIARVEFPKLRIFSENTERLKLSCPVDHIVKIDPPEFPERILSQKPEAIRARERVTSATKRARKRFAEIVQELS